MQNEYMQKRTKEMRKNALKFLKTGSRRKRAKTYQNMKKRTKACKNGRKRVKDDENLKTDENVRKQNVKLFTNGR